MQYIAPGINALQYIERAIVSSRDSDDRVSRKLHNLWEGMYKALRELHFHQLVHNDVKPENFVVDDRLRVYIVDFGSTLTVDQAVLENVADVPRTRQFIATAEQLNQEADIGSLRLTLR